MAATNAAPTTPVPGTAEPGGRLIGPHEPFAARYLDFGKVFVPNGALDFSTLACSDAEVARFGPQLFNRGLVFPDSSPFAAQIGAVSAALLMFEGGYLFTLVQRRREGELSVDPRTDRPFNQVRFVLLSRETIAQAFAARAALYTGLAQAAHDPAARVWLTDYTAPGQEQPWNPVLGRLDPAAPDSGAVRFVVDAVVAASRAAQPGETGNGAGPQPISVPLPAGDLLERLQLVEAVQYWVLPRLGVLSFALDYVTIQNVHLRLFLLPADAPAPLPPERVFLPGKVTAHLADDYYTALSALEHEAVYDEALSGLLRLPISAAEAVRLYRVEKQAQPLSGEQALCLYPALASLGERRFNLLRRVPRDDRMDLLRQPALPPPLRHDLLLVAFEASHGLLPVYARAHLAVPRAVREDIPSRDRIQELLRASVGKSLEASLAVVDAAVQAELFRDLLLARRVPAAGGRGQPVSAAPLALATGQPLLEALILWRRTPELAGALREVIAQDSSLFREALDVVDRAHDLPGLLWLWQSAGRRDLKHYATLLERAVQPGWYAALARDAGAWRALLQEGRALSLDAAGEAEAGHAPGVLLRALPRPLVPFVWQACLATAERDAAFAEWWLFDEALALPEQLPQLWQALQRLPAPALRDASPRLNYLLGRPLAGMSLLEACTLPGHAEAHEALYATVLRAWLEAGFRSEAGDLLLGTGDVDFLIDNLPGSNDILAAIAASPAQSPAVLGLPADSALHWGQAARGERRKPYRASGRDTLFERLIALHEPDEALLWHLLVEDDGTSPDAMSWPDYLTLLERCQVRAEALSLPAQSRLRAYLDVTGGLQNKGIGEVFQQNGIDVRRVLALLAAHSADAAQGADLVDHLLLLAVFHLQETGDELKGRAGSLLRAALRQPDVTARLQPLPDNVLAYLRQHFGEGQPELIAAGHWIDAELSRRNNSLRPEKPAQAPSPRPSRKPPPAAAPAAVKAAAPAAQSQDAQASAAAASSADAMSQGADAPTALVGELALPGSAPRKRDSAVWLWLAIVVIAALTCAVLVGALLWIQSLS